MTNVVVIGAGVGGLTAAAALAKSGLHVTVLESHVYPGGCAGTFYYQGYRFDAGATLAGGFRTDGPMDQLANFLGLEWDALPTQHAMRVHLPDGRSVDRWSDQRRWAARLEAFGLESEDFWHWQEATADVLWKLITEHNLIWPPQSGADCRALAQQGLAWLRSVDPFHALAHIAQNAFHPVARRLDGAPPALRKFIDGQLLISAQATSAETNALYGAAALDLPRQGIVHFNGGMGRLSEQLVEAVERFGGKVMYRQKVQKIVIESGRPRWVETSKGLSLPADVVIANLPSENLAELLPESQRGAVAAGAPKMSEAWGAFVVYLGLDGNVMPKPFALHQQVLRTGHLAEGNSIFLSASRTGDLNRAPFGHRTITLSTHTRLAPWWELLKSDPASYEKRKEHYLDRMISGIEKILPGVREASGVILPGTPVTFQRFTARHHGWVGGHPQTSLFRAVGPRLSKNLWQVGDSIFPGQSTTAVALGGMRVASQILRKLGVKRRAVSPEGAENAVPDSLMPLVVEASDRPQTRRPL